VGDVPLHPRRLRVRRPMRTDETRRSSLSLAASPPWRQPCTGALGSAQRAASRRRRGTPAAPPHPCSWDEHSRAHLLEHTPGAGCGRAPRMGAQSAPQPINTELATTGRAPAAPKPGGEQADRTAEAGRARVGARRGADEAQSAGAPAPHPTRPPPPRRLVRAERAARARNVAAPERGAGAQGAGTKRRLHRRARGVARRRPGRRGATARRCVRRCLHLP